MKQRSQGESKGGDCQDCCRGMREGQDQGQGEVEGEGRHRKEEDRGGRRSDQGQVRGQDSKEREG